MAKHSRYEREQRAAQNERAKAIGEAWRKAIPQPEFEAFQRQVEAALARPPVVHEDMAPGTRPNPPRREPPAPKEEQRKRRY